MVGEPLEETAVPPTTRLGRRGRPDRGLHVAAAAVVVGLALALAKPWDWGASPTTPVEPAGTAAPTAVDMISPPPRWTDLEATASCLSNRLWLTVVDEAGDDGRTSVRSWTRLDLVPAAGPEDPRIARIHVYADAVPRIGFCAPTRAAGVPGAGPLVVAAWRLERGAAAAAATAVSIAPIVASGGDLSDGGAVFAPPAGSAEQLGAAHRGAGPGDPEAAWSADGDLPWRPAGWSTGPVPASGGRWPPGTYVFRVSLPGAGPDGADEAWFSVDLRGPWRGPDGAAREPGPPDLAPGAEPTSAPGPSAPAP